LHQNFARWPAKTSNLVEHIAHWKIETLVVTGYADHLGKAAYNDALSVRRALAVKAQLVSNGIPANRIYTQEKGFAIELR
jgi:OOP family OmpA-OmpF porin